MQYIEYLNVYTVSLLVDTISANLLASQDALQQHAEHSERREPIMYHNAAASKSLGNSSNREPIGRVDLERPLNCNELGQAFVQCCDIRGLQMQASKAADPELG